MQFEWENLSVGGAFLSGELPDFGHDAWLKRSESGFDLRITLPSGYDFEAVADSECMGWFVRIDGNAMLESQTGCPRTLTFHSDEVTVTLLDCEASRLDLGIGRSVGLVSAARAIIGNSTVEPQSVSGLVSKIPAALHWAEVSSLEIVRSSVGPLTRISVAAENGISKVLSEAAPRMELKPRWSVTRKQSRATVTTRQWVEIESASSSPVDLGVHLARHDDLMQLIEIAAGAPCGYNGMWVLGAEGVRYPYMESGRPAQGPKSAPQRFMFRLDHLPTDGFDRWVDLRRRYNRGLNPLRALVTAPPLHIETATMLLGVAVEQIGATALREQQPGLKRNPSLRDAAEAILGGVSIPVLHDADNWCDLLVGGYNGIKHPNRVEPAAPDLARVVAPGIVLLRAWVASRIGCDAPALLRGVASAAADDYRNLGLSRQE